jgi:hypothetical protein
VEGENQQSCADNCSRGNEYFCVRLHSPIPAYRQENAFPIDISVKSGTYGFAAAALPVETAGCITQALPA